MSTDMTGYLDLDLPAAADLSSKQYYFVQCDSSGNAAIATRGSRNIGVLQNAPAASTRAAKVRPSGVTKVVLGGSATAGQNVVSDANGAAVNASSADNYSMGIFLESGSSGSVVRMLLQPVGLS